MWLPLLAEKVRQRKWIVESAKQIWKAQAPACLFLALAAVQQDESDGHVEQQHRRNREVALCVHYLIRCAKSSFPVVLSVLSMDRRIIRKFREAKLQSKKQKPDEREGHNLFDYFSRDAQLSAATETTSLNERVTAGLLVTRNKEKRANTDRHGTHTHTHATALRDSYRSYSIVEENNLFSFFFFLLF